MNPLGTITLETDASVFRPFDELRGSVAWHLESPPKSLELRLFWFTSGRGTPEAGLVEVKSLPISTRGEERFSFTLPASPCSFSGKLIRLSWALELVAAPIGQVALREFALGLGENGVELPAIDQGKISWWKALQGNR